MTRITSFTVLDQLASITLDHVPSVVETHPGLGDYVVPEDLRTFLAELRLLQGVPFGYLVPDSQLLPPESIRFFYIDRAWTDSLVQGALSVGTVNSGDRAELEQLHAHIRDEIDETERQVRVPGGEELQRGPAGLISGFLLRSRAVSGWPGLHVRAYEEELGSDVEIPAEDDPRRVKVMRMERLAPAVLLVLFDGVPKVVHIEEPRQGVQFGVRLTESGPNSFRSTLPVRDPATSADMVPAATVDVPFRPGSPGVLDLKELSRRFAAEAATGTDGELDSAELALQMIRFPYRQVFGDPDQAPDDDLAAVFAPTVAFADLEVRFLGGLS